MAPTLPECHITLWQGSICHTHDVNVRKNSVLEDMMSMTMKPIGFAYTDDEEHTPRNWTISTATTLYVDVGRVAY